MFDEVKKNNDELEEKVKRMEKENTSQLKEITKLKKENAQLRVSNKCLKPKPSVCDVSCGTESVCSSSVEFDIAENICVEKWARFTTSKLN